MCSGHTLITALQEKLFFVPAGYCIPLTIAEDRRYADVAIPGCVGSLLFCSGRLLCSTYCCRRSKVCGCSYARLCQVFIRRVTVEYRSASTLLWRPLARFLVEMMVSIF
jgi:hypothetical protein